MGKCEVLWQNYALACPSAKVIHPSSLSVSFSEVESETLIQGCCWNTPTLEQPHRRRREGCRAEPKENTSQSAFAKGLPGGGTAFRDDCM